MGREERLRQSATRAAVDPAFEPLPESQSWLESGPYAIVADPALATLIVRVGMATNALVAQFEIAGEALKRKKSPYRMRGGLLSLVTTAAFTNEAISLARRNMSRLRDLASRAGAKPELLTSVGQLCAGHHPASTFLSRARNQLGFHWDADAVAPSVREFGKNKKLIWIETDTDQNFVHRLALEVINDN